MLDRDWTQLRRTVEDLLDAPEPDRRSAVAAMLEESAASPVRDLMAAAPDEGFLEPPIMGTIGAVLDDLAAPEFVGQRFGPYRAVERIGSGGMGTVYKAVRADQAFQRVVAVKVMRQMLVTSDAARRFDRERHALAQLSHPNIAALLDGGRTSAGLAYLVIEYVDGVPLTAYPAGRSLSVRDRVRLFMGVCDAVRHAHQHLIIHRDLKPANILVTADGTPKLLDFGIARLVEADLPPDEQQTITLVQALTPRYASPEQVRGEPTSTASDVYSLGVILYELLTGQTPRRLGATVAEAIAEYDRDRVRRPGALVAGIDRDLDAVVLRALSANPRERYQSAEAFGEELRRYIGGMPVRARTPSRRYVALKWVRRHKGATLAIALGVLTVAAFVTAMSATLVRLDLRRREALRAQDTAERINLFLGSTMEDADWRSWEGEPAGLRDLLSRAARRATTDLSKYPSAEANVRLTLGRSYLTLGLVKDAGPQYRRAMECLLAAHGADSAEYAKGLVLLSEFQRWSGDTLEAHEGVTRGVEALRRASLDPATDVELADSLTQASNVCAQMGSWAEAEAVATEAITIRERASRIPDPELAAAYERRAIARTNSGRAELAAQDQRTAVAIFGRCTSHKGSLAQARAMCTLGRVQQDQKDLAGAEKTYRDALAMAERVQGVNHPTLVRPLLGLSRVLAAEQMNEEALEHLARAARLARQGLPSWHYVTYYARYYYGVGLTGSGRLAEAEDELLAAHAAAVELVPEGHMLLVECSNALHDLYTAWGRSEEADKWPYRSMAVY